MIPVGSVEIQTGLYLYQHNQVIGGKEYTFRKLYSADGYCFYDVDQPENYDEDGNLVAENERVYAQYAALGIGAANWTNEQINAKYISVPVKSGYQL